MSLPAPHLVRALVLRVGIALTQGKQILEEVARLRIHIVKFNGLILCPHGNVRQSQLAVIVRSFLKNAQTIFQPVV